MASKYELDIVTPNESFFTGDVEMTIVRTTEGDVGILKDHELLVAPVSVGAVRIMIEGKFRNAACAGGFVSVDENKVTIVTDAAEWEDQIDIDRAKGAYDRAKKRLEGSEKEIDVARAQGSLTRATNRLRIAGHTLDHS